MITLLRAICAGGAGLLALSFFIPYSFHNSPVGRFRWAIEGMTASGESGTGSALYFLIVAFVFCYSYVWAGFVAATVWWPPGVRDPFRLWGQLGCQIAGGVVLVLYGAYLLIIGDDYIPTGVQLAAVLAPIIFVGLMLAAFLWERPRRRIPAITVLGCIPFVPLQPILAYCVWRDGGPPWGYLVGTAGALLAIAGGVCLYLIGGIGDGDESDRSDVQ